MVNIKGTKCVRTRVSVTLATQRTFVADSEIRIYMLGFLANDRKLFALELS